MGSGPQSLSELLRWCRGAPPGTSVPAAWIAEALDGLEHADPEPAPSSPEPTAAPSWRERLWIVPAETRIGTHELAEALGRPKSWVYARTQTTAEDPLPFRKLDGSLTFTAGEIRHWIREHEEVGFACPFDSAPGELRAV